MRTTLSSNTRATSSAPARNSRHPTARLFLGRRRTTRAKAQAGHVKHSADGGADGRCAGRAGDSQGPAADLRNQAQGKDQRFCDVTMLTCMRRHVEDVQNASDPEAVADEKMRGIFDKARGMRDGISS